MRPRRPSAALVVALIALFVALGGPAEASRLISGKQVKNHSLQTKDLSRKAVRQLRRTPASSVGAKALENGAVTNPKLRDGAVTAVKIAPANIGPTQLAPGAVGPRELRAGAAGNVQIADGSVTGAKIADGTLDTRDIARFSGRFRTTIGPVNAGECWSGEPVGLAPDVARADIAGDVVLVTPGASWPETKLAFTFRNSTTMGRFVLAACNVTAQDVPATEIGFRYVVLDLP